MNLIEHEVSSLKGIEEIVRHHHDPLRHCYLRGQRQDWPLIPLLGRKFRGTLLPVVERQLMESFLSAYLERMKPERPHPDIVVDLSDNNQWRTLAVAQHYGLPTRLLDWTFDFKVAAYFAVKGGDERDECSDGVIYLFWDRYSVRPEKATIWPELNIENVRPYMACTDRRLKKLPRVKAQFGALTIQPVATEDLTAQLNPKQHSILKLRIKQRFKRRIREELAMRGITESNLFDGLDGLCREVTFHVFGVIP